MKFTIQDILEGQKIKLATAKQDLQGKTLLITGGNAGKSTFVRLC
jgi:DNA mismatch repair ATPase MutS